MIDFFAHFGLAVGVAIVDVLFCASTTFFVGRKKDADISDQLFINLAIANTVGYAVALSFLILGV